MNDRPTSDLPPYAYSGARAMVGLHEKHLWRFLAKWRRARAVDLTLPATSDPDYASLEALLFHVCRAARGYMTWMCEKLELPDPAIEPPPPVERIGAEVDAWLAHLLARWREPLAAIPEERFYLPDHASRWQSRYCIDGMLEHAVMHPIRHELQLDTLLAEPAGVARGALDATALAALAARWISLWSAPTDWTLFDALHADDFADRSAAGRDPTKAGFARGIRALMEAFPDLCASADDVVVDAPAQRVAVRWTARGTNRARYLDVGPTHAPTTITGIEIIELADGRIARRWGEWDITQHTSRRDAAR